MEKKQIRVLIVEDDEKLGASLQKCLEKYPEIEAAGICKDRHLAVRMVRGSSADVVVANLYPGDSSPDIICMSREIRIHTDAKVLILSEAEMAVFHIMMGKKVPLKSSSKTIANQKTRVLKKLGLANQKDLRHVVDMFRENGEND